MPRSLASSTLDRFRKKLEAERERLAQLMHDIEEQQEVLRLSETSSERGPDPNTAEGGSLAFEIGQELSVPQNAQRPPDPAEAACGTIRYEIGRDVEKNSVHASDSEENADREISFFFDRPTTTGTSH